ncbi:hypothetical protein [Achromobacter phage nyashin_LB6]|nr:hypothetical protein [Achromobacter phage nyashin_LB6]
MTNDEKFYRERSRLGFAALEQLEAAATFTGLTADELRDEINQVVKKYREDLIELRRKMQSETDNAGLPTYAEILGMLKEAQRLGLTFDIGTAYISRAYIDKQTELNARIKAAIPD